MELCAQDRIIHQKSGGFRHLVIGGVDLIDPLQRTGAGGQFARNAEPGKPALNGDHGNARPEKTGCVSQWTRTGLASGFPAGIGNHRTTGQQLVRIAVLSAFRLDLQDAGGNIGSGRGAEAAKRNGVDAGRLAAQPCDQRELVCHMQIHQLVARHESGGLRRGNAPAGNDAGGLAAQPHIQRLGQRTGRQHIIGLHGLRMGRKALQRGGMMQVHGAAGQEPWHHPGADTRHAAEGIGNNNAGPIRQACFEIGHEAGGNPLIVAAGHGHRLGAIARPGDRCRMFRRIGP